jgi:hypothetical protein
MLHTDQGLNGVEQDLRGLQVNCSKCFAEAIL